MTNVKPGGNRRIDRVLDPDFVENLVTRPLATLRERRLEAEQEEADLSYVRRLLHGRIDIVQAEQRRREHGETASIMDQLPQILASGAIGPARELGRLDTRQPSQPDRHRRRVEAMVADLDLSDVTTADDQQLAETLTIFQKEERAVSELRRQVQRVADTLTAEIARRYAEGEADITQLLP